MALNGENYLSDLDYRILIIEVFDMFQSSFQAYASRAL